VGTPAWLTPVRLGVSARAFGSGLGTSVSPTLPLATSTTELISSRVNALKMTQKSPLDEH